jgi:hypothetical protein
MQLRKRLDEIIPNMPPNDRPSPSAAEKAGPLIGPAAQISERLVHLALFWFAHGGRCDTATLPMSPETAFLACTGSAKSDWRQSWPIGDVAAGDAVAVRR